MGRKQFRGEKIDRKLEMFKRLIETFEEKREESKMKIESDQILKEYHHADSQYWAGVVTGLQMAVKELEVEFNHD